MILIDKQAAIKELLKDKVKIIDEYKYPGITLHNKICDNHIEIINNLQPAREIIYCKDCKYGDWYEAAGGRYCYCFESSTIGRTETDFCSRGEVE